MLNSLHLVLLFLSDFGIMVGGQSILYCQLSGSLIVFLRILATKSLHSTTLYISLIAVVSGFWSLYFNYGKQFGSHSATLAISLSIINLMLFAVMLEATRLAAKAMSPRLLSFIILLHTLYFVLEFIYFNGWLDLKPVLQLLHNSPKALEKMSMSLFGREHSYGSMGPLLILMIAAIFYDNKAVSSTYFICVVALTTLIIVILTSKTVLFTSLVFLALYLSRARFFLSWRGLLLLISGFSGFAYIIGRIMSQGYLEDILLLQGGSSFSRFYYGVAGLFMFVTYPWMGVGLSGYKFNFREAVEGADIPVRFDLEIILSSSFKGGVDPTNFFIGIFSEFGLFLGAGLLFLMFKEYFFRLERVVLACLVASLVSFFGFYYWGQPFVPLMLILPLIWRNYENSGSSLSLVK